MNFENLIELNKKEYVFYLYEHNNEKEKLVLMNKFMSELIEKIGGDMNDFPSNKYSVYFGFSLLDVVNGKLLIVPKTSGSIISTIKETSDLNLKFL